MLKTSRKLSLAVILLLCVVGLAITAYCYFWVTSNEVHVDMQYAVDLTTVSISDSVITLNAAVTNNGVPVRAGLTLDFYYSVNAGVDWIYFATQLTDAGGAAQATYTATANGAYDFRAVVTIP